MKIDKEKLLMRKGNDAMDWDAESQTFHLKTLT
jgi:hypothetical protein